VDGIVVFVAELVSVTLSELIVAAACAACWSPVVAFLGPEKCNGATGTS